MMTEFVIIEKLDEILSVLKKSENNKWFNIQEIIKYSCCSDSTIRRAINKGVLKASHSTGKLLFKMSDVDRWLQNG